MSLARRWLDPIRSRWFLNRSIRPSRLSSRHLVVYLRLDDAYSYLAVQILHHLDEILQPKYRPLKVVICTGQPEDYPNGLSAQAWLDYTLGDAQVLASQHRFIFQPQSYPPDQALMDKALMVIRHTHLTGSEYLHLLQNVFHMLWQRQTGKLDTLWEVVQRRAMMNSVSSEVQQARVSENTMLMATIRFGGRSYRAIDDLLRLTRRLKRYHMLSQEPVFLIDHVEWREHLVSDPVLLADIQACHAVLDVYVALEDPLSWLILAYLKREMADYYNIQLYAHPLPYQGRDQFDWNLASRLSIRAHVPFAPFCRPDQAAVNLMAKVMYQYPPEEQVDVLLKMLEGVWCQGLDPTLEAHLVALVGDEALAVPQRADEPVEQWLQKHQQTVDQRQLPELPVMELHIRQQRFTFCGLYRVWQVETLLSQAIDESAS